MCDVLYTQIVYGLTPDGEVYFSDDEGANWFHHSLPETMPKINQFKNKVSSIHSSGQVSKESLILFLKVVYFLSNGPNLVLWITTNNGANYTLHENPEITEPAQNIFIHPTKPSISALLVSSTFDQFELYYSTNYGEKWKKLADVPRQGTVSWTGSDIEPKVKFVLDSSEIFKEIVLQSVTQR